MEAEKMRSTRPMTAEKDRMKGRFFMGEEVEMI